MALLYAESGSLLFAKLGLSLNEHIIHYPVIMVGVGMMLVGIGFKLSFVPFQLWTPDVYQGAPAPVATFWQPRVRSLFCGFNAFTNDITDSRKSGIIVST